jgi:hypothetical protein
VVLNRLTNKSPEIMQEVRSGSVLGKFFGRGQQITTLLTFKGVLKLIMALPGVNAREMREKFVDVLRRYFAGDPSLVSELVENNASGAPINQFAREDAGVAQVVSEEQIKLMCNDAIQQQLVKFETQRKRKLYDERVAENRREKEHKRRMLEMEKDKEAKIAVELMKMTAAEKEKAAKIEIIDTEKAKLELEVKYRPLLNAQLDEEVSLMEKKALLTEKLIKLTANTAPCVVSVSRVAEQVLPVDTMSEAFRDRVLVRAGNYAVQHLPAERNKILSLFGLPENWYHDKYYERVAGFVGQAYKDVQATWEVPKEKPAERPISAFFAKGV